MIDTTKTMQLFLGDCLEIMKEIPDKSIDMVLCDLPYGTTACKWDTIIPFEPLWEQYKRIIKDNGAITLFGSEPFSSHLRLSNLKDYKYDWIWEKSRPSGGITAKFQPTKKYENISIFGKNKINYFPIMIERTKEEMKYYNRKELDRKNNNNNIYGGSYSKQPSCERNRYRYPNNILIFKSVPNNKGFRLHPTQKPVALFEYLIKTYTNEGNLVLDNCAGSGTTGVACKNLKRNCILIEKELNYVEIIKKRLEEIK